MTLVRLLTPALERQLRANGLKPSQDHVPVVKLFNPVGAATWLAAEMEECGDRLFGLADLGMGCPELGWFSLGELEAVRLPFGLTIERDLGFRTVHPLSVWAGHARETGSIIAAEQLLRSLTG